MDAPLQNYQTEALKAVQSAWKSGLNRPIIGLGAGLSNPALGSSLAQQYIAEHRTPTHTPRVLVLANRRDIVAQNAQQLRQDFASDPTVSVGTVMAQANEVEAQVVAASVQSLSADRLHQLAQSGSFDLIVIDNAPRRLTPQFQRVLDVLEPKHSVEITTTPYRQTAEGLQSVSDRVIYSYQHLPITAHPVGTHASLDAVPVRDGDFVPHALEQAVDVPERNTLLVQAALERAPNQSTLAFATTPRHAEHLAQTFQKHGVSAHVLDPQAPPLDRARVWNQFLDQSVPVLVISGSFDASTVEGAELPPLGALVMARPTCQESQYLQMLEPFLHQHTPSQQSMAVIEGVDFHARQAPVLIRDVLPNLPVMAFDAPQGALGTPVSSDDPSHTPHDPTDSIMKGFSLLTRHRYLIRLFKRLLNLIPFLRSLGRCLRKIRNIYVQNNCHHGRALHADPCRRPINSKTIY